MLHSFLFNGWSNKCVPFKILLLRTSALGDFLFAVPSMIALRKRLPFAKIVLLTTTTTNTDVRDDVQRYAGNSSYFPWLSFVVPSIIDDALCFQSINPKTMIKTMRPKIKAFNPDMTFILSHPGDDFLGLLKKMLFLKLLGVQNVVYGWRMYLISKHFRAVQYKTGLYEHKVMGPLRAITGSPLFSSIRDIAVTFPLSIEPEATNWAANLWENMDLKDKNVVAVAPGSIQPHKRWPVEKFIMLCKKLVESYDVKLLIIGTSADKQLGDSIVQNIPTVAINITGQASIQQSAAVLRRCILLVGNDGGAMHLGAAVGCKCVSIVSGIEYPGSIEPWDNADLAVRHDVSCSPCYSFTHCPKKHNKCLIDLPVEAVFAKCSIGLNHKETALNVLNK